MRPINMCTLEVRIGKCNLNLKSDGYIGVSLEMGNNISSMSLIKRIQSNPTQFNTTLRMNIEKSLLEQQANPKCRILLHLIRQSRDKKVIGIATVDIVAQNNQGFKSHQFGQCADCEADIQVSISCGLAFELGVRSEIAYFQSSQSQIRETNNLQQSRGIYSIAEDSILDNQDYNILKQSKAASHIAPYSSNHPKRRSLRLKPRRNNDIKKLRREKPQNFSSCAPQEIITHYETQIKTFEEELIQRDEWASGMKILIQELEAENQLLKELTIDEMEANNITNLEQGIDYVSKLVHSKFQASRSMIYESTNSQERRKVQTPENDLKESQIKQQTHEFNEENGAQPARSLKQTKSYKDLPKNEMSPHMQMQNSPQRSQIYTKLPVLQSRQQLQNALKILTGEDHSLEVTQLKAKISQLQEGLFSLKQEKQQLYESTSELYAELKNLQLQRDSLCQDVKFLEKQLEKLDQYIEQIKTENQKLNSENQKYQNNIKSQQFEKINLQNQSLHDKSKQLERQMKESLKAIEQFKNDALNARSELITKEDQLNCYRMKFGDLGSMTDVFINGLSQKVTNQNPTFEERNNHGSVAFESPTKKVKSSTNSSQNLHSLYTQLLENSITERRELQHSLSQIITSKTDSPLSNLNSVKKEQKLKRLQTQVNKMFIEMFKNNAQIQNIKQLEKAKVEVTRQIEEIISI